MYCTSVPLPSKEIIAIDCPSSRPATCRPPNLFYPSPTSFVALCQSTPGLDVLRCINVPVRADQSPCRRSRPFLSVDFGPGPSRVLASSLACSTPLPRSVLVCPGLLVSAAVFAQRACHPSRHPLALGLVGDREVACRSWSKWTVGALTAKLNSFRETDVQFSQLITPNWLRGRPVLHQPSQQTRASQPPISQLLPSLLQMLG